MFMERSLDMSIPLGYVGMITLMNWMFLSSFEEIRKVLTKNETFLSMAHLGARAFDTIGGEVVSTTMFMLKKVHQPNYQGTYLRLVDGTSESEKQKAFKEAIKNPNCGWLFYAKANDFNKIPGVPIAYWISEDVRNIFKNKKMHQYATLFQGIITGDNNKFLRY